VLDRSTCSCVDRPATGRPRARGRRSARGPARISHDHRKGRLHRVYDHRPRPGRTHRRRRNNSNRRPAHPARRRRTRGDVDRGVATRRRGRRSAVTATSNLPEWLRPAPAAAPAAPRVTRVAVLARTSTDDQQDPTLSIPRQYANCERALLPNMQIVLVFYDIESSRKELDQRGSSTAWKKFQIPIRRDGGIADLLAE